MQNNEAMESACRNTVGKAMQKTGIKSRVSEKFTPGMTQADSSKKPADNLLNQNFKAETPNRKWVTNITYLAKASGWVYLAVVLDLFSRKVSAGQSQKVWPRHLLTKLSRRRSNHADLTQNNSFITVIAAASTPATSIIEF